MAEQHVFGVKGRTYWDSKRKRHVQDLLKQLYLSKAV